MNRIKLLFSIFLSVLFLNSCAVNGFLTNRKIELRRTTDHQISKAESNSDKEVSKKGDSEANKTYNYNEEISSDLASVGSEFEKTEMKSERETFVQRTSDVSISNVALQPSVSKSMTSVDRPVLEKVKNHKEFPSFSESKKSYKDDVDEVVIIVLCFLLPPLAVYLFEGSWTKRCTINLILTLLCGIPGVIHALLVVLK